MENKTTHKWMLLVDYIERKNYGDVISFQEIENVIGERRKTPKYYQAISKAKVKLEESGKMIRSIGGGDYQVIYPGDYSKAYAREIVLANRRVKHGNRILTHAPVNDMTLGEKQVFDRVSDFHASLQARLAGNEVEVKKLCGTNHPFKAMQSR